MRHKTKNTATMKTNTSYAKPPSYSLRLKTSLASAGLATLCHPNAEIGIDDRRAVYEVQNIPVAVPVPDVIRVFNSSVQVSGWIFNFADLGAGRIVRGATA